MKKYILLDLEFKDIEEKEVVKEVKEISQSVFESMLIPSTDNLISFGILPINIEEVGNFESLIEEDLESEKNKNKILEKLKRKFYWNNRKIIEYIRSER